ncbi:hypothetical protein LZ30DRAFT_291075 [Colletotrichum cereale]|nr:hypothetical protein LZ30DRAFT_291075 [Colletotrichum cereale]
MTRQPLHTCMGKRVTMAMTVLYARTSNKVAKSREGEEGRSKDDEAKKPQEQTHAVTKLTDDNTATRAPPAAQAKSSVNNALKSSRVRRNKEQIRAPGGRQMNLLPRAKESKRGRGEGAGVKRKDQDDEQVEPWPSCRMLFSTSGTTANDQRPKDRSRVEANSRCRNTQQEGGRCHSLEVICCVDQVTTWMFALTIIHMQEAARWARTKFESDSKYYSLLVAVRN